MRFFFNFIILIYISNSFLFGNERIDNLSLTKIKKLVQKEEQIAIAYKKYILSTATLPSKIDDLKLSKGFNFSNNFNNINLKIKEAENKIIGLKGLQSNALEYYHSNKYRTHTKAPLILGGDVEIKLSSKEKFIVEQAYGSPKKITTDINEKKGKYYLDDREVIHWHDNNGVYKFSLTEDIMVDKSVTILDDNGKRNPEFMKLVQDVIYAGQKIYRDDGEGGFEEYINTQRKLIQIVKRNEIIKILMRIGPSGAGLIINGDIQTWGNNSQKTVSIGTDKYTKIDGKDGTATPIINTIINAKAMLYDDRTDKEKDDYKKRTDDEKKNNENLHIDLNDLNGDASKNISPFYSSPIRPRFIDFFLDSERSLCAISLKQELYCGGKDILEKNYKQFQGIKNLEDGFDGYTKGSELNMEYLYRSKFFNGKDRKVESILFFDNTYLVLSREATDNATGGYNLYYWGKDNKKAWAGTGNNNEPSTFLPIKSNDIRFKEITYTLIEKQLMGLNTEGDVFLWGGLKDGQVCDETGINSCKPQKVVGIENATAIFGLARTFIVVEGNNYFRVSSTGDVRNIMTDILPESISDIIYSFDYVKNTDKLEIVWINANNELKGNYNTRLNTYKQDEKKIFDDAIKQIKWEQIRVMNENDAMCGIDINKQMYCWGDMKNNSKDGLVLPLFNSNLFDKDKDYMFLEKSGSSITSVTSGNSALSQDYIIKYPTFIGGFNYDVIFK